MSARWLWPYHSSCVLCPKRSAALVRVLKLYEGGDDDCNFSPVFFPSNCLNLVVFQLLVGYKAYARAMVEEHPPVWPHMRTGPTMRSWLAQPLPILNDHHYSCRISFTLTLQWPNYILWRPKSNPEYLTVFTPTVEMWKLLRECIPAIDAVWRDVNMYPSKL